MWEKIDTEKLYEDFKNSPCNKSFFAPYFDILIRQLTEIQQTYLKYQKHDGFAASEALLSLGQKFPSYYSRPFDASTPEGIVAPEVKNAFAFLYSEVKSLAFKDLLFTSRVPTNSFLFDVESTDFSLVKTRGLPRLVSKNTEPAYLKKYHDFMKLYKAVYFYSKIGAYDSVNAASLHVLPSSLAGVLRWPFFGDGLFNDLTVLDTLLIKYDSSDAVYADEFRKSIIAGTFQKVDEVILPKEYLQQQEVLTELFTALFTTQATDTAIFKSTSNILEAACRLIG